jgi:hypothetical protein
VLISPKHRKITTYTYKKLALNGAPFPSRDGKLLDFAKMGIKANFVVLVFFISQAIIYLILYITLFSVWSDKKSREST